MIYANHRISKEVIPMKVAFAIWNNRIAPVFDVARQLHIIEVESGKIIRETEELLPEELPVQRALRLTELGVQTLVCGAISRPMHAMVVSYGILVIPFVAGNLNNVKHAWLHGTIGNNDFAMPGCWGKGNRFWEMNGMPPLPGRNWRRMRWRNRWGSKS